MYYLLSIRKPYENPLTYKCARKVWVDSITFLKYVYANYAVLSKKRFTKQLIFKPYYFANT